MFLLAKPWKPGVEKSIYTIVIHWWRSLVCQFARERTIDENGVTVPVTRIRVKSQINCSDVTMLNQKKKVLSYNGEFGNRWLFLAELSIFWKIASLVTQKVVIHGNSCIILYFFIELKNVNVCQMTEIYLFWYTKNSLVILLQECPEKGFFPHDDAYIECQVILPKIS